MFEILNPKRSVPGLNKINQQKKSPPQEEMGIGDYFI